MAIKTIRLATKVNDPKTFEQKHKTIDGEILSYTPQTAWVQSFGKQPRLLRNSGVGFVPNPLMYGLCRPSRLSDYIAYKSARKSGPCLRFLDIEDPKASRHKRRYGNRTNKEIDKNEKRTGSRQSRTKQRTKKPKQMTGQNNWTKNGRTPLQQTSRNEPRHDRKSQRNKSRDKSYTKGHNHSKRNGERIH